MRYRVAFEKRANADGSLPELEPSVRLEEELPEGIVAEKTMVEAIPSDAQHSQEALDEDDAFLGLASTEVWEYAVVEGRNAEFEDALKRSKVAFEFTIVDETDTPPEEAGKAPPVGQVRAPNLDPTEDLTVRESSDPSLGLGGGLDEAEEARLGVDPAEEKPQAQPQRKKASSRTAPPRKSRRA